MAQQTAVEWLVYNIFQSYMDGKIYCNGLDITEEIEQAKQIEKEQIMQSYNDGKSAIIHIEQNKSLEQYYNETYKSE